MQKLQATLQASILIKSDNSQRRFLAQHSFAIMLEQCCNYSKQCRNNVSLRSKRFLARFVQKAGTRAKKKRNDGGGGGESRKRLPANSTILKNFLFSPSPPTSTLFFFAPALTFAP